MARRRKDIKKRRKIQEEQQVSPPAEELEEEEFVEEEDTLEGEETADSIDDDEIVLTPESRRRKPQPETVARKPVESKSPDADARRDEAASPGWFGQNKDTLLLGLLVIYVLLLGLGTVGELFEIAWILDLPLFR